MITTNLSDFESREWLLLQELVKGKNEQGLPEDFGFEGLAIMMNQDSGFVFFTNEDFQVAMMNGNKLESFYTCSKCGSEGFSDEIKVTDKGCTDCCEMGLNDDA